MPQHGTARRYPDAQTRTIATAGATFAYLQLGPQSGVPLVLLTHLGANLDGWDPRIADGLAHPPAVHLHGHRETRRTRVPRSAEGTHDRVRQARHRRDVSCAVACGAPLGAAGSRRMVVGR